MHLEFVEPGKRYVEPILPAGGHTAVGSDTLVAKLRSILFEA